MAAGKAFTSTLTTGPYIRGDGNRSQINEYFTVYTNTITGGSILVRGRWDWADDPVSGKWSTEQQGYSTARANRDVTRKRLLIRGSGPAVQYSFRSDGDKQFELIGWTAFESADGTP